MSDASSSGCDLGEEDVASDDSSGGCNRGEEDVSIVCGSSGDEAMADDGASRVEVQVSDSADSELIDCGPGDTASEDEKHNPVAVAQSVASSRDDVAEYYSRPRLVPRANARGLKGAISADLVTGWNFLSPEDRRLSLEALDKRHIKFIMLSPPCTMFSALQRLWNFKHMNPQVVAARMTNAVAMVDHSMECAEVQVRNGRRFVFEHPASAASWSLQSVKRVIALPGVEKVLFDQCAFGLCTKIDKVPMRKRTYLLTNCDKVIARFSNKLCSRDHKHRVIEGSEGGMKRSVWAQFYPLPMVEALVDCV